MATHSLTIAALAVMTAALVACGGSDNKEITQRYKPLDLENAGQIQVNGYLWQATLDTLSFMPMASTDAEGGVILTDWYVNPRAANERSKVHVDILDARLRADVLRVSVNRQVRDANGQWVDAPVQQSTIAGLEDAILMRARQIRIETVTD